MIKRIVVLFFLFNFLCFNNVNALDLHEAMGRAIVHAGKEEYAQAIKIYDQLIQENPKAEELFINRGFAYFRSGDLTQAEFDFNKSLLINPNFAIGYGSLAIIQMKKKNYIEAIDLLNRALAIDSNLDSAYNNRGLAYLYLKEYRKSLEDLNRAKELGLQVDGNIYERVVGLNKQN